MDADLVLTNGTVLTHTDRQPEAGAVAVVNDYLDIITPTDDVAPDAHLDDVGD